MPAHNELKELPKLDFKEGLVLGILQITFSKLVASPFEMLKLGLQLEPELVRMGLIRTAHDGALDLLEDCINFQGLGSLWTGSLAEVIKTLPNYLLSVMLKKKAKDMVKQAFPGQDSIMIKMLPSGMVGAIGLFFTYPFHLYRTRATMDTVIRASDEGNYSKTFTKFPSKGSMPRFAWIEELFSGFSVSIIGMFTYQICFRVTFSLIGKKVHPTAMYLIGFSSTVIAGLVSYPLDTLRRRQMVTAASPFRYESVSLVLSQVHREGFFSLWYGAGINIIRGFAGALAIAWFERSKRVYIRRKAKRRAAKVLGKEAAEAAYSTKYAGLFPEITADLAECIIKLL